MRPWVAMSTLALLLISMLPVTPAVRPAVAAAPATPPPAALAAAAPGSAAPAPAASSAMAETAPDPAGLDPARWNESPEPRLAAERDIARAPRGASPAGPFSPAAAGVVAPRAAEATASATTVSTRANRAARVYTNGSRQKARVALTFDAGADRGFPDQYLKILADRRAAATFFLTGNWARANPGDLAALAASGHPIANHTISHPDLVTVSEAEQRREILETEAMLMQAAPRTYTMLFRPPYGSYNAQVNRVLGDLGYANIMWDVDTLDWMNKGSDFVAGRFRSLTKPGSIVLMHMAAPDTVAVLPDLIDWLGKQGLEPVTLPELLQDDAVATAP